MGGSTVTELPDRRSCRGGLSDHRFVFASEPMSLERSDSLILPRGWSDARGTLGRLGYVGAYLVLGALTLSPLLWAKVPPLVDYPDHLARMWVLLHAKDIPALASNYVVDWRLLPNLAMDLIVPALAQFMPLEAAGRVFIALTMLGLVLATALLHRALHGRVGLLPLASLLFVYNLVLYWGFVNFLFTMVLALLTFSAWIMSERRHPLWRAIVFAPPAAVLLIFHLFGFGIYGLLVASYELAKRRWSRRAIGTTALLMLQFVPAMLLLMTMRGNGGPGYTRYSLASKPLAALVPVSFGGPLALDWAVLFFAIFFLLYATRALGFRFAPAMRWPIIVMVIAAVLMPVWLSGSSAADWRLPATLPFVVIASLRFDGARPAPVVWFALIALTLLGARIWAVSASWRDADRRFAEFRVASQAITEGARLLVVQTPLTPEEAGIDGVPRALAARTDKEFWHMPTLAIIDRSVSIPYFFTGWTPVRASPRNADVARTQSRLLTPEDLVESASPDWQPPAAEWPDEMGAMPYWRRWPEKFDFVLWIDFGQRPAPLPDKLQLVATGSFFKIYRIIRRTGAAAG
ncbi:MAG TPA: hypothetical protein VF113_07335 [Stellaceae bacterium]